MWIGGIKKKTFMYPRPHQLFNGCLCQKPTPWLQSPICLSDVQGRILAPGAPGTFVAPLIVSHSFRELACYLFCRYGFWHLNTWILPYNKHGYNLSWLLLEQIWPWTVTVHWNKNLPTGERSLHAFPHLCAFSMEIEYFINFTKHNNLSQIIVDTNWLQHLEQDLKKYIYFVSTFNSNHSVLNLILALSQSLN